MDFKEISEKIRVIVLGLAHANAVKGLIEGQIPVNRAVVVCLQMAWADAIRDELQSTLDVAEAAGNTKVKEMWGIAKQWMNGDHDLDGLDPVCMLPGTKPTVISVDGKECVSFEHTMVHGLPLSAVYLNRVSEFMGVVDAYDKAKVTSSSGARDEAAALLRQADTIIAGASQEPKVP